MKQFIMPAQFDGAKFATRYGLNALAGDFFVDGQGLLNTPDSVPDNPIFDAPDPVEVIHRNGAKILAMATAAPPLALRAAVAVLIDELNLHADKINAILSAVDAATTLADLKTRIGLINDYPQRTLAQAKTSILNKIDSGEAD